MTKWLVMKFVNTAMLTQTSWVILVYNMSLHKGNNNIANLCMLYLTTQALHSITTLIETSYYSYSHRRGCRRVDRDGPVAYARGGASN